MNKKEIVEQIKEIVVEQCKKEPAERDLFEAFGALIDKIENSIKEEEEDYAQWRRDSGDPTYGDEEEKEDWFLNEVPWEEYFNNGKQA